MFQIGKFSVTTVEETKIKGVYQIRPLPKGFGQTVGNALRRILLSYISGAAITAIKIEGVEHEYSNIKGLQEDIVTIVMNLKNVAIRSFSKDPIKLHIKAKGKKDGVVEVKASDIETSPDIEILNKEFVIAHLTLPTAKLNAEITIEQGIGYQLPDDAKRKEIGVIPVDAMFSPVQFVRLNVVQTRVGQQTDLDQIDLEIVTNGAMKPKDALVEASQVFYQSVARLIEQMGGEVIEIEKSNPTETLVTDRKPLSVYEIDLSTRLRNSLVNSGIEDLMTLEGKTRSEIASFKGMGKKTFEELLDALVKLNVKIKG